MRSPRLSRSPRRRGDDDGILPLINVVFLLLIFFMVVGRLTPSDPVPVAPPEARSGVEPAGQALTVFVTGDGRIAVGPDVVTLKALADAVAARWSQEETEPLRVKADGAANAGLVVDVMRRLREAGIERVRLMTVPEPL